MSMRTVVRGRGYFGIGVERSKTKENVGTLLRSAVCLGADFIFTVGSRFEKQASDTVVSFRHIPLYKYKDMDDFNSHRPYNVPLVGVELCDDAHQLETFVHPERAIYLLGPEDGSLSKASLALCQYVVKFQSAYCLNVAAAGTVVMYDRQAKLMAKGGVLLG